MIARRTLLAAPSLLAAPAFSQAQTQGSEWRPDKSLTMIVAFAAGGGTDAAARTIARFMEKDLGQSGRRAQPPRRRRRDRLHGAGPLAAGRADHRLHQHAPHRDPADRAPHPLPLEDFALIANIVDDPGGLWVRADSEIRDFAALLAAARARPETIGYGTTGVGSDDHLAMLALERASG
jgi:tripartite-type tricarboxylate transporter receptor subunit TctC